MSRVADMLLNMSREELKEHVYKLDALQRQLTSLSHISRVNSFIPIAYAIAEIEAGGNSTKRTRIFHREMNRLTSRVGIRSV